MRRLITLGIVVLTVHAFVLSACNNTSAPTPAAPPVAETPPITFTNPPFTFRVMPDASATAFDWSVEVPTGGWALSLKMAQVPPPPGDNHAKILVLLRKPDPNDMVTQAFETHTGNYRHGKKAFESAELLVKLLEHDQDEKDAEYERAAYWRAK